jgi:hypothetical protein
MAAMRTLSLPVFALTTLFVLPVAAQSLPGGGGIDQLGGMSSAASSPGGMAPQGALGQKSEKAPPPSLPGARARPDTVIPLKGGTTDLAPTDALFDAINRGDILSARDAINRGADLDSTNLLGLTPIELSVDLGRNDISFLLLSLRGASGSGQASRQPAGNPAPVAMTQAEKREAARAMRVSAASTRAPANVPVKPAAPRTPALYAGNGGAPVPAAGFLGFDHH